MGNEESTMVKEGTPTQTLQNRSIEAVARYIKEKDVKRIVVMVSLAVLPRCVLKNTQL